MILSAAMMLEWLGVKHEIDDLVTDGAKLRESVEMVVSAGRVLTRDLGGNASTIEAAIAVQSALRIE